MPMRRISLLRGKPPSYLRALGARVRRSVEGSFGGYRPAASLLVVRP